MKKHERKSITIEMHYRTKGRRREKNRATRIFVRAILDQGATMYAGRIVMKVLEGRELNEVETAIAAHILEPKGLRVTVDG